MSSGETITITLPTEMLREVRESVGAGDYASASEAMSDALRLWQRERLERAQRLDAIRARVARSVNDPRPELSLEEVDAHIDEWTSSAARNI